MTSREIIQRVVSFDDPPRIGMNFSGGRMNDFTGGGVAKPEGWSGQLRVEGEFEIYYDEWGNLWHRIIGKSAGGEIREPVLKDWSDLDKITLPDYADPKRYEGCRKHFAETSQLYRFGSLPGWPFAIMRYMRKMEVFFADLILHRDYVDELHGRVIGVIKDCMRNLGAAGADACFFCEDWGTQQRLLVHPDMWREIFKPGFAELVSFAGEQGLAVWMHTCGYVYDIIPDLIEVGVKVLQFDQPCLHGVERLGENFGGKVTFWCPVDIQKIMPTGDRDLIRSEAKKLVDQLGSHGGGFVAKNYGDLHGIGVEQEWDDWAYDAFVEFGTKPN